jgi:hypothetical protein
MNDWLYPLSSRSRRRFVAADGFQTQDTSPASFEAMLQRRRTDDDWTVATNFRRINKYDRIWVYYGKADGDLGIVGLATVRGVTEPERGKASVRLKWEKDRSRQLLKHKPFPAAEVRRRIRWPRAAVVDLTPHSSLLKLLHAHAGLAKVRQLPAKKSQRSKRSSLTYTPPRKVTVDRRHDAMIYPVQTRLETCGWSVFTFRLSQRRRADLAMMKSKRILLIEFKTIKASTTQPVRDAFSQLHEYKWRYRNRYPSARNAIHLWAIFERQPSADDLSFLEDSGLLVSWVDKKMRRVLHNERTRDRLDALGVAT